jgi:hypothetical protein
MLKIRTLLGLIAVLFLVAGCETTDSKFATIENYLGTPSSIKLNRPIYFVIQDQRPQEERQQPLHSAWIYTTDRNTNEASLSLGSDLCRVTKIKGIADQAFHGLPSDSIPANSVVIHINLLSWYGRLENPLPITGTIMAIINPSLATITAEGHCKFSSVLESNGKTVDLGISEGSVRFQVSRNATIAKEGNQASGAVSDEATAQFFRALENQLPK